MPAKVFITHSHHDLEFARRLRNDLAAHSLETWFDNESLKAGERLAERINQGLAWCDTYIPIITRASLASPWCSEEISAALALCNRPARGKQLRIIPVLAEDCPNEMPPSFLSRLYFNFAGRYTEALRDLLHKGFGIDVAPPDTPPSRPESPRIQRLQSALTRLTPPLRTLDEYARQTAAASRDLAQLPDRWRGKVPDREFIARLEGLAKISDLMIAAAPHLYTMSSFLTTYGNPQFGIRPGNLAEALKAYRAMAAEANAGAGWTTHLLQAVQEQTFLPPEMSQSLTRLITRARDQVHLLKTELAKLGDI